jgi:two-component system alkaline phosphatase synthesis response regulator PhoP
VSRENILIVEDQRGFRRIYQDVLENEGYSVFVAEDGEKGLDLTRFHKPDLILLDLGLPRMNGFEVLQKIREDVSLDKVQVVIFSVTGEEKDVEKALAMGANGYVLKGGYTPRQVIEVIQGLLSPEKKTGAKVLKFKIPQAS